MSLLDRYVGRIVAGAFAATLVFFVGIWILLDLLNSLPKYIERAGGQGFSSIDLAVYLGVYYVKAVPGVVIGVMPFVTVIACMFAVARLQQANEVVPMLFLGRSVQRVLRPMLLCGVVAGLAMAASWQWIMPHVGESLALDEAFLRQSGNAQKNLVHEFHGEVHQYLSAREYDPVSATMSGVHMLVEGTLAAETTLVSADQATWDKTKRDWRLTNGKTKGRHGPLDGNAGILSEPRQWLERPDLTPMTLVQQSHDTINLDTLSYSDLIELTVARPNRADVRLALHRHIAYPLANLLLLLLALPFAVFYERGSRIERVLLAIAVCGAYMLMDLVCQSLGQRGLVHPIVAAWSPTIVFGALGIVLFGSTKT
ncbi:MAG TPA: LptF/LptG family permease [Planctomycetota bacterium]|nr:LptF/LptG family permease [Planctomycetota bacterium]